MKKSQKSLLLMASYIFYFLIFYSCSEGFFRVKKINNSLKTDPIDVFKNSFVCGEGNYRIIRPQVDILFLWDNSTSTVFLNQEIKNALSRVVETLSGRFDFHILLSPLIGSGNSYSSLVTFSEDGLSSSAKNMIVPQDQASNALSNFPIVSGNNEAGLSRAVEMISINQNNGIFRQNAYTIVTLMSHETDLSYVETYDNATIRRNYLNARANELLCLRGNYNGNCSGLGNLNSQMMRFISIVAQNLDNSCAGSSIGSYQIGQIYEQMSSKIYGTSYTNGRLGPVDQNGARLISRGADTYNLYDSHDICKEDYAGIFDGLNNAIQDTVINHSYNFWPVADSTITIDPSTILAYRNDGTALNLLSDSLQISRDPNGQNDTDSSGSAVNGYRYVGVITQNTRFLPDSGEPQTGHMIELFGNAKITYPQCIRETQASSPKEYFGYAHMADKPLIGSISLKINGNTITQNNTNGWELMTDNSGNPKQFTDKNIKIISPTNTNEASPALIKSGYFLKLYGSAIYSNGAVIDVLYDPQTI